MIPENLDTMSSVSAEVEITAFIIALINLANIMPKSCTAMSALNQGSMNIRL